MIVAIASGKGGTGKTTVAVNLARLLGGGVHLLDCDVEEPNDHLFLPGTNGAAEPVTLPVPEVDQQRCDACGACSDFCAYHAIVSFGIKPLVFPELCHGCGGCALVCPRQAIREVPRRIGEIRTVEAGGVTLVQGRIDVGVPSSPPLIRAVRARAPAQGMTLVDAPPGTSCPVVAAVRGADLVVLVTEPTPFGLHDLELAVALVRELGIPCGVVINRAGSGDDRVHAFCRREGLPILAQIPDDRRIAEACSRGRLVVEALPEYEPLFRQLSGRVTHFAPTQRC
ncbi:MAG: ATP-binding protein [Krumholzibacteria bacterium]|nr:ATP-binding protein [Candidatus Krumholzibacteria bacterium]